GKDTDRLNRTVEKQMEEIFSGGPIQTFLEVTQNLSDEDWDKMLSVHLYGTFHCTREALKVMEAKSYGKIVNMASVAATLGIEGIPHYCAAKAGILGFTRAVAREVAARKITVNAIAPGFIETPMTAPISPVVLQAWIMNTPMKKSGKPKDVAAVALY